MTLTLAEWSSFYFFEALVFKSFALGLDVSPAINGIKLIDRDIAVSFFRYFL